LSFQYLRTNGLPNFGELGTAISVKLRSSDYYSVDEVAPVENPLSSPQQLDNYIAEQWEYLRKVTVLTRQVARDLGRPVEQAMPGKETDPDSRLLIDLNLWLGYEQDISFRWELYHAKLVSRAADKAWMTEVEQFRQSGASKLVLVMTGAMQTVVQDQIHEQIYEAAKAQRPEIGIGFGNYSPWFYRTDCHICGFSGNHGGRNGECCNRGTFPVVDWGTAQDVKQMIADSRLRRQTEVIEFEVSRSVFIGSSTNRQFVWLPMLIFDVRALSAKCKREVREALLCYVESQRTKERSDEGLYWTRTEVFASGTRQPKALVIAGPAMRDPSNWGRAFGDDYQRLRELAKLGMIVTHASVPFA
jgi:hypothetical protein